MDYMVLLLVGRLGEPRERPARCFSEGEGGVFERPANFFMLGGHRRPKSLKKIMLRGKIIGFFYVGGVVILGNDRGPEAGPSRAQVHNF